jgi:glycosyltransferase involved in cell wall biosynthesis
MSDRLRILLSIHHEINSDSGAPGSTLALRDAYAGMGHDVRLLSFDDFPVRLPFRAGSLAYPPFVAQRLARETRRGLDVIDASAGDAWMWASLTRRGHRPLLVTRSHGLERLFHERIVEHARLEGERLSWKYWLYWGGWRLREVEKSLRAADLVLVLNDTEHAYVTKRLGVPDERVRLTTNGLRDGFLDTARTINLGGDRSAIAYVGEYRVMKGVAYGARALTGVMADHPEATVSFIGTGVPREQVLAEFPPELHARIKTIERYERPELPNILEGHGILLFPSLSEGFSLALLESMACGLAPVAAANVGAKQIVKPERSGLLVPLADAGALEAALRQLLDDPSLLKRLQEEARKVALGHSWNHIAEERVEDYREALARRRAG